MSALMAACKGAKDHELGAGDVVWSRAIPRVDMAIVLEPECSLASALQMVPLALVATGDCLGALAPPQVSVLFRWPSEILVNGGLVGHIDARWPEGTSGLEIPDWLIIGFVANLMYDAGALEPGMTPEQTVLAEEGCRELTRSDLVASYSRHFLTWLNIWNDDGFRPVHDAWLLRAAGREEPLELTTPAGQVTGTVLGLDEEGNLLLQPDVGNAICFNLMEAISGRNDRADKGGAE